MKPVAVLFVLMNLILLSGFKEVQGQDIALQAFELRMNGHPDSALAILSEAVKQYPDSARIWFEYGRCIDWMKTDDCTKFIHVYTKMNLRLRKAKKCMGRAAKLDPLNGRYRYWHGQTLGVQGLASIYTPWRWPLIYPIFHKSTRQLRKAVALLPDNPQYRYDLVNYEHFGWFMGGNMKNARLHTDTLADQHPVYAIMARDLLKDDKHPYNTIAGFSALLTSDSSDITLLNELAFAYRMKIRTDTAYRDSAFACYRRALQIDPGNDTAIKEFCRLASKRADVDPIPCIREYLDIRKEDYGYYRALGLRLLAGQMEKQGMKEEAERLRSEAKALNPRNNATFLKDLEKP